MSETYHPYIESDVEKDDDTDKKDKKKRAERSGGLLASQAVEQAPAERPLKLGSELLRPLSIEVAKPEVEPQSKDREAAEPVPAEAEPVSAQLDGEQALPEGDLQQLQAELAALNPEAEDNVEDTPKAKQTSVTANEPKAEAAPDKTEAAFQAIANAPELADLAHLKLPAEGETPAAMPPVESMPAAAQVPELAASDNPDKTFNEIVEHSLDETPPGPAQFFERAPGESPVDAGAGEALPPVPPTIEGGEWGSGDGEPWQQPAGGLGGSRIVDAISAVEAKHELDDLYHTSRENGLAAAVGLLGLGLVIEHIVAKRRDKKLKKQIAAQGRQLKKTNQTVHSQHYTLQAAQRKLARLHAGREQPTHGVETAAAAAAAGVVTGSRETTKLTPAQEKVLADRLEHSKELGIAMARNPELQKETLAHTQQQHTLERSFENAATTIQNQEQQLTNLQHEVNYEKLQSKYADNGGAGRQGRHSAGTDASGMPMLPYPQDQLPSGMDGEHLLEAQGTPDKRPKSNLVKPVAVATVLVILAAVIVMVYIR